MPLTCLLILFAFHVSTEIYTARQLAVFEDGTSKNL